MAADVLIAIAESIGGARKRSVLQHFGPASYVQMTTGPVAGGDVLPASKFGLKTIETVQINDVADDGVTGILAVLIGKEASQITVAWFTAVTMVAQYNPATNLSAISVRIEVTGL